MVPGGDIRGGVCDSAGADELGMPLASNLAECRMMGKGGERRWMEVREATAAAVEALSMQFHDPMRLCLSKVVAVIL